MIGAVEAGTGNRAGDVLAQKYRLEELLGAVGLLMSVAHSRDGWGIVRAALPANATAILAGQAVMALVVAVVAGRQGKRAFDTWNGDAGGGRSSAVVSAVITGALFFAAIELVRGAW